MVKKASKVETIHFSAKILQVDREATHLIPGQTRLFSQYMLVCVRWITVQVNARKKTTSILLMLRRRHYNISYHFLPQINYTEFFS